jgi:uncharacterized protein (TIGR01777 family)
MKILIAGASGFIGKHLVATLAHKHEVVALGRNINTLTTCFPKQRVIDWQMLAAESPDDYQIIINLCGENIGDKPWTDNRKAEIINSRKDATEKLCNWALSAKQTNALRFINASAVGVYGLHTKNNTEETVIKINDNCFSQQVVLQWEAIVREKLGKAINYTLARFGVVLQKNAGMLKKLEPSYRLGLASILGNGQQLISWVHIDDLVQAIEFIINNPTLSGPVNIVAPEVATQKQFAQTMARAMGRPCFLTMPEFLVKLLFGQMGAELLLAGQEVIPKKLIASGFSFKYSTIEKAIFHEYQAKDNN